MINRGDVQGASVILMAPDDHRAIWEQWHRHIAFVSAFEGILFADLPASQVAALHEPDEAHLLSERYLLPLQLLELRVAQKLVDDRFPHGAALVRLENDGTVRYAQALERVPVVAVTPEEIFVETDYPAGPFDHRTRREAWTSNQGPVVIPDPDGDGSRVVTADLAPYERALNDTNRSIVTQLRDELPRLSQRRQTDEPWWSAPVTHPSSW